MGTGWLVFLFLELRNHTYRTILNTRELERFDVCMPLHGVHAATCIGQFGRYAITLLLRNRTKYNIALQSGDSRQCLPVSDGACRVVVLIRSKRALIFFLYVCDQPHLSNQSGVRNHAPLARITADASRNHTDIPTWDDAHIRAFA